MLRALRGSSKAVCFMSDNLDEQPTNAGIAPEDLVILVVEGPCEAMPIYLRPRVFTGNGCIWRKTDMQ